MVLGAFGGGWVLGGSDFLGWLVCWLVCYYVVGGVVEARQNGIIFSSMNAAITSQFLEQLRIVRILLLVFLRNTALVLPKVNKQFRNITQPL